MNTAFIALLCTALTGWISSTTHAGQEAQVLNLSGSAVAANTKIKNISGTKGTSNEGLVMGVKDDAVTLRLGQFGTARMPGNSAENLVATDGSGNAFSAVLDVTTPIQHVMVDETGGDYGCGIYKVLNASCTAGSPCVPYAIETYGTSNCTNNMTFPSGTAGDDQATADDTEFSFTNSADGGASRCFTVKKGNRWSYPELISRC